MFKKGLLLLIIATAIFLLCLVLKILVPFHWENGVAYLDLEYYKAFTPGRLGYLFLVFAVAFSCHLIASFLEGIIDDLE